MKSSTGIADIVSYLPVPREPSSSDTRATVLSSGASITLMKSNCPSVAHCALTVAPSCSTSRFTSRMRAGLFLIVCTPSGVSVVSMMYVGTLALLRVRGWSRPTCTGYDELGARPSSSIRLHRCGSRGGQPLEHQLTAGGVHATRVAGDEPALEDRQRERVDEPLLDHALERAGAVGRVIPE